MIHAKNIIHRFLMSNFQMYSKINLINKINYIDSRAACINREDTYENTFVNTKMVTFKESRWRRAIEWCWLCILGGIQKNNFTL